MTTSGRRRVGRTLRRSRRSAANGSSRTATGIGPLQAIGENTVVDLTEADVGSNATGSCFIRSLSPQVEVAPSLKKQHKKKGLTKKRPRESVTADSSVVQGKKKRKLKLMALLDELETQVEEQCSELLADAERRAQDLEMELKVQLMFLPEAVRRMSWQTFVRDFGGDLHSAIHSVSVQDSEPQSSHAREPAEEPSPQPSPMRTRSSLARHSIVAATPGSGDDYSSKRNQRLSAFETPLYRRDPNFAPNTVVRTVVRRGETLYTARGSPVMPDLAQTVVKAPAGSLVTTFGDNLEASTCIRLDDEHVVDLSRPEELSEESRGEATSKLQALQAKVAQLLQQINPAGSK